MTFSWGANTSIFALTANGAKKIDSLRWDVFVTEKLSLRPESDDIENHLNRVSDVRRVRWSAGGSTDGRRVKWAATVRRDACF
jgi:hypothetical protein